MKTIASYDVKYVQILDPDGNVNGPLPAFANDQDELMRLYRMMVLTRQFDTKAINLQRTGKLGTYASCLGHEAAHVGIGSAMEAEDVFAPMYREYGAQLWRGVKMSEVLQYWGGDERGNDFSGPRHDFPWCVPIATQCLHAAGAAMAFKLRREPRCAVAVIGDGGTSEGAFYEAMNLAGAQKLPVVFVVVNNKWAISVPIELQTAARTLAQKAFAAGIPGIQVDGNDVFAVREALGQALSRARRGEGASLVEAVTYRLSDHTTADDASRYRPPEEVEQAWKLEPLKRYRKFLENEGLLDESAEKAISEQCTREIESEVAVYLDTPMPTVDSMFDYMYETPPHSLVEQREYAKRYDRGESGGH
ncbi:MAG: pyruvate dehydrogenase (acetyl-transferring) E1 component subunit alpha [Pseudomonadota bacterium]